MSMVKTRPVALSVPEVPRRATARAVLYGRCRRQMTGQDTSEEKKSSNTSGDGEAIKGNEEDGC